MNKPILVVSDIHGSLSGANLVMEARKIHDPAYVLCLGDVLYHGPRNDLPQDYAPKKVIEIMNSINGERSAPAWVFLYALMFDSFKTFAKFTISRSSVAND